MHPCQKQPVEDRYKTNHLSSKNIGDLVYKIAVLVNEMRNSKITLIQSQAESKLLRLDIDLNQLLKNKEKYAIFMKTSSKKLLINIKKTNSRTDSLSSEI